MASKSLSTLPSRLQLLSRPTTGSPISILSTTSRAASTTPSRSLSTLTRRQLPRQTLTTSRTGYYAAPRTQSQLRHQSNKPEPPSPSPSQEIKSYKFEDINPPSQILIDVRQPPELLSTGIIPTSLSIPLATHPDALFLSPSEFKTRFGFSKPGYPDSESDSDSDSPPLAGEGGNGDAKIVFYCKAGVRARAAAQLAVKAGYKPENLGVYDGSWLDWERRGGKVERWEGDE